MQNYIYIETYGCTANKNNSEIIAGILKQAGYEITNNEKIADILIINSCIVKGKTEQKIKRRIQDISKIYKNKLIIVSGCMPETNAKDIKRLNKNAILLGIHHIKDIVKLIKDFNENKLTSQKQYYYLSRLNEEKIFLPKFPDNKLISIAQISEGCFGDCSYCKTKIAKGRLFSYEEDKILKSIENDLENGAKEVWITSQDNASYGLDKEDKKSKLPELLNKILSLKHNFKIRIGMMNPNNLYNIIDDIFEIYKNPKVYKFLHIPIQSASDKILKDMNRFYKIEQAEEIINKFRKEIPEITIATDIIVSYPSETKEAHEQNLDFIKRFKPDVLNLSKFSSHKGTEAGKLKTLAKEIINQRSSDIMELHRKTAMENKQKFLNRKLKIFVNNKTKIPGIFEARDNNYNIILIKSDDKALLGKTIDVKITQIGVHHMLGIIFY